MLPCAYAPEALSPSKVTTRATNATFKMRDVFIYFPFLLDLRALPGLNSNRKRFMGCDCESQPRFLIQKVCRASVGYERVRKVSDLAGDLNSVGGRSEFPPTLRRTL